MTILIGTSLGRYHILEQLGEGGMAVVYKAYDTRLEREVAIKIIRTEIFGTAVLGRIYRRFEREAKALARLNHPNIVSVIEYGEHDGSPFLVMQYIPAGTLKSKLGRPILWHDALSMLIPISKALAYSHSQGIIHRDVKPSNILVTLSGELMLTDFGIAKLLENDEGHTLSTGTGVGIGTPEYMAPEQGMGKDVDARADIYSLGIILYEMLTGRKPFTADTPMAVIVKHLHDPLPRAKKYVPDLPDPVERVLLKSLAKKPDDRYQDMSGFGRAMDEIVHSHKKKAARTQQRKDRTQSRVTFFKPALRSFVSKLALLKHIRPSPLQVRFAGLSMASILVIAGMVWFARQPAFEALLHPPTQVAPSADPIPTSTFAPTSRPENTPTLTFTATPNPTSTPPASPTLTLKIGSTMTGTDGMTLVYVPAGEFTMGGDADSNEMPIHTVYLDGFWIDQTEVTNKQYAACVSRGGCTPPSETRSSSRASYYGNSTYNDFPVIYVDWNQASAYCSWAGRELPTEAQWEKAARGTDSLTYPWGNESPNSTLLNFNFKIGDTTQAGSYESGKSPYGAYDMAGNVWEWVNDWYSETYYQTSPSSNPLGPDSGSYRVLRSSSWFIVDYDVRSAIRNRSNPASTDIIIGFRCARGTSP